MSDTVFDVAQFHETRANNIAFFKKYDPSIYAQIAQYKLQHSKLSLGLENGEVDLIQQGVSVYEQRAKRYGEAEVDHYLTVMGKGKPIATLSPPFSGDFKFPRFFNQALDAVVSRSAVERTTFPGYFKSTGCFPLLVMFGVGLGYHIKALLERSRVLSLILVEPDLDCFVASLYLVDWQQVVLSCCMEDPAEKTEGSYRPIEFLLGRRDDNEIVAQLNSILATRAPFFPAMTLFYNHLGNTQYDEMISAVNQNITSAFSSWGNYDDEAKQLNHILHNNVVGHWLQSFHSRLDISRLQVCIVGSGPSLDARIDDLKKMRHRLVVFSCGSSITALVNHGIMPDIHIELESDPEITLTYLDSIKNKEVFENTILLASVCVNPLVFQRFRQHGMVLKAESGLCDLVSDSESARVSVRGGVPTCVNFGVSLSVQLGFKTLFLFGVDFGFRRIEQHHSSKSCYFDPAVAELVQSELDYQNNRTIKLQAMSGEALITDPFYYAAKSRLEGYLTMIRGIEHCRDLVVFNASDGAKIEGTVALTVEERSRLMQHEKASVDVTSEHERYLEEIRLHCNPGLSVAQPESVRRVKDLQRQLLAVLSEIKYEVPRSIISEEMMLNFIVRVMTIVNRYNTQHDRPLYCLISGSIKYYLFTLLTHWRGYEALARDPSGQSWVELKDPENEKQGLQEYSEVEQAMTRSQWVTTWSQAFLRFLSDLPDHFCSLCKKPYGDLSEPWLLQSMKDPEHLGESKVE